MFGGLTPRVGAGASPGRLSRTRSHFWSKPMKPATNRFAGAFLELQREPGLLFVRGPALSTNDLVGHRQWPRDPGRGGQKTIGRQWSQVLAGLVTSRRHLGRRQGGRRDSTKGSSEIEMAFGFEHDSPPIPATGWRCPPESSARPFDKIGLSGFKRGGGRRFQPRSIFRAGQTRPSFRPKRNVWPRDAHMRIGAP